MIEIWESPSSGDTTLGDDGISYTLEYTASGSDNKLAILAELLAPDSIVPEEIGGIPRRNYSLNVIPGHTQDWDIVVEYSQLVGGSLQPSQVGEESETFSIGSGSVRMFQALQHLDDYARPGKTAPNHGGAINVTPDRVEGVDVSIPIFVMRITKIIDSVDMTTILRENLFKATNAVNSHTFRGFQPGELRLIRTDAHPQDSETWRLTFEFEASENLVDLQLGAIPNIQKQGHDYLWAEYETVVVNEGTENARTAKQILYAHTERIYSRFNFNGTIAI